MLKIINQVAFGNKTIKNTCQKIILYRMLHDGSLVLDFFLKYATLNNTIRLLHYIDTIPFTGVYTWKKTRSFVLIVCIAQSSDIMKAIIKPLCCVFDATRNNG